MKIGKTWLGRIGVWSILISFFLAIAVFFVAFGSGMFSPKGAGASTTDSALETPPIVYMHVRIGYDEENKQIYIGFYQGNFLSDEVLIDASDMNCAEANESIEKAFEAVDAYMAERGMRRPERDRKAQIKKIPCEVIDGGEPAEGESLVPKMLEELSAQDGAPFCD